MEEYGRSVASYFAMESRRAWSLAAGMALVLAACGDNAETAADGADASAEVQANRFHPDGWAGESSEIPEGLYDPIEAGEQAPAGFRQVLKRDWIAPVYDPAFVAADKIDWPEEELVIGVDLEGEARAYPVGFLNRREIVIDMHRGIPTFVTW